MAGEEDVLSELDKILKGEDTAKSPWKDGRYRPDMDLARRLLRVPISKGLADKQATGRVAKSLDAWIAHELRRAGFPEGAVWPRRSLPRVQPEDLSPAVTQIEAALKKLDAFEERLHKYEEAAKEMGLKRPAPKLHEVRPGIRQIGERLPGKTNAEILGAFYNKQVDVVVSSWQRGPDVLVSTKTMYSSYLNNKNNRYEEAVGEGKNLRDRHPLAAMGFAYLVRSNIFREDVEVGAFEYLRNLLIRLRKPHGFFDATMLLVARWEDAAEPELEEVEDPTSENPPDTNLSAPKFFEDLIGALLAYTPADVHTSIRYRDKEPLGGVPPLDEDVAPDEAAAFDAD
ncbi:MAG TPA: hypothetical protein VGB06_01880 [Solirubrobacterales bacterium]|jgi:hypothetical protein